MNLLLYLLFGVAVFSLSLVGYKNYRSTTLYALAIGGVVNSNYFHALSCPIYIFDMPFGIDSLIYTLFAFCVMVMLLQKGKREAYLLTISSIVAILFSACMQLVAELFTQGNCLPVWESFHRFAVSALGGLLGSVVAIQLLHNRQRGRGYSSLCMGIGLIVTIHRALCVVTDILFDQWHGFVYVLTTFMGKGMGLLLALMAYWLMCKRENH